MRNSQRSTTVGLALILLSSCGEPPAAPTARAERVAAEGTHHVVRADGRPHSPYFKTIQEGLDLVDSGGTVLVAAGTYPESLVVTKGVTLRAHGGPVIIAPDSTVGNAVLVTATQPVVIHGLTVDSRVTGVFGRGLVNLTFDGGTVLRAGIGIQVSNSAAATGGRARLVVRNSAFDGGTSTSMVVGVFAVTDVDAVIQKSTVRRTSFGCIQAQGTANADIIGNIVDECGPQGGIRAPMLITTSITPVVNVIGNTIRNSTASSSRAGILIRNATGRIENNSVVGYVQVSAANNTSTGAIVIQSSGLLGPVVPSVRFNDVAGNAYAGLRNVTVLTVDATCNWWGSPTGPTGIAGGTGDILIGSATVVPFATAPVAGTGATSC